MPNQKKEKHTISVLVNDEPGALARVIGLFSGRGYNIDSLTVAPVNLTKKYSRIIIVTSGTKIIIEQIIHSLERLIQVKKVIDSIEKGNNVKAETGFKGAMTTKVADALEVRRQEVASTIVKTVVPKDSVNDKSDEE